MLCDINSERCQGSLGEACDVWLTGSLIGWLERENGNLPVNMDFCFIWYQMRSTSVYRGYRSWWQGHWKWDKEPSLSHIHMHNDNTTKQACMLTFVGALKNGLRSICIHVSCFYFPVAPSDDNPLLSPCDDYLPCVFISCVWLIQSHLLDLNFSFIIIQLTRI